jgi:hypothetical protein
MDEAGTWVWIHAGENRAINLRHVTDVEFEQGPVLAAHLYLTALDAGSSGVLGGRRVTVEGPEAEALHAYLARVGCHLEDLGAG